MSNPKSYLGLKTIIINKLKELTGGADISGITDGLTANKLIDSGATFETEGIEVGDLVQNTTDSTTALVTVVDSETELTLDTDIFTSGENYTVGAQLFANVYGVSETEPNGYPTAWVVENTGGGEILDTHRNQREWQFDIIMQVQVNTETTPEVAYDMLLDAADRVIADFDEDPMLLDTDGQAQCQRVRVVPLEFQFGVQDGAFHRAVVTVAILDVVNRQP